MTFWKKWFAEDSGALKRAMPIVEATGAHEAVMQALSDEQLKAKTAEFKERLAKDEDLEALAPEAFAAVREASRRTLLQRHFDVQLVGGIILHRRGIAEMKTGEGKTLVATLPAYLNALTGRGVHVITVNDYLSRRDAVWMGQVYGALGMTVGILNHEASFIYDSSFAKASEGQALDHERDILGGFKVEHDFLRPCNRREAYEADITYGTNNEFGFDYLRDNLEYEPKNLRQWRGRLREPSGGPRHAEGTLQRTEGGYHFAIVDEIDSILIDEARTPLIISAPVSDAESLYATFAKIAGALTIEDDYTVDEKHKQIALSDLGIEKAQKLLGIENIYTDAGIKLVHHLETAVRAKALYERDKAYVIRDGQVVIVDEFTGRMQPGRRWSDGLHQAIEAKEGVSVQQESRTFASITFQNYFRLYEKLAGMTGTAVTSSEEFYKVYGLNTVVVPTNKQITRIDAEDQIFQTEAGKYKAMARKVKELHENGQPVLIGTVSVEKNELLSAHFKQEGIPHELLNAKNHEREGEIIAQAGKRGGVTVATNMAGRGVDIKLGGNPGSVAAYEEVKQAGGLFVLGKERHEARRIDNQLRGRAGRQGDPGETQFFVSLEDPLMKVFASDMIKRVMGTFSIPEDEPIYNKMITRSLEKAQTRIEEMNFDARKHVLAYDDVLNIQRTSVYARRFMLLIGSAEEIDAELERIGMEESRLRPSSAQGFGEAQQGSGEPKRDEMFYRAVRRFLLQTVDGLWVDHLEQMEYLRSSVNLRAYGQRDPLVEYKKEALNLFKIMEDSYIQHVTNMLPNVLANSSSQPQRNIVIENAARAITAGSGHSHEKKKYGRNDKEVITNGKETQEIQYKKAEPLLTQGWRIVSP